ncbi:MAG: efflux RND transporter permease subunit [Planctomycetaceae bacterium]|nr:efflux RND transporter permease subunit [Planctomycetaceae bacterium]
MFSRFFIDRPIFATVLSVVIVLGGGIAYYQLPLTQYPPVTPPTVFVRCTYPGASAEVVAQSVAAPIEQQVNGVEGMIYMESQSANDGTYSLSVTFRHGIDLNLAQVLVQNRVNLALPMLPDVLKRTGVITRKMSPDMLMSVNIYSPHGRYDQLYLSNYAVLRLRDEMLRVPGVSDINVMGQRDYSMRIWLDPDKLAARRLTAGDIVNSIREQNVQVASGSIGQEPVRRGQETQITLATLGRLEKPEQFADIVIRTGADGRMTRLRDVGRVEMGARNQDVSCKLDGYPSAGLFIIQLPDANALDVAERVRAKMDELAVDFPEDLKYAIFFDTTPYTRECKDEVLKALRDAVLLVAFVVLLFLQNWRSAIIPLVAVPVAIVGTFAVLLGFGFSLNTLTLFGLVLAIGIVVDDAIVVVEAVEHHIEQGLAPREATIKAMSQVSGPVIAVGLVLSAVFVPCAFISGLTGQFFRQFALTIAASTIISAFNSLTLSPALSALLLRPRDRETHEPLPRIAFPLIGGFFGYLWLVPSLARWLARCWSLVRAGAEAGQVDNAPPQTPAAIWWIAVIVATALAAVVGWLIARRGSVWLRKAFHAFNAGFAAGTRGYTRVVGGLLRISVIVLIVYGGMLFVTYRCFNLAPKGFVPAQDMGFLYAVVQLPDAASIERTRAAVDRAQQIAAHLKGVKHTMAIAGSAFGLGASGSNFGQIILILDDFAERHQAGLGSDEIAAALRQQCEAEMLEAKVSVLPPPPIRGIGRSGGFKFVIEDRRDAGVKALQEQTDKLVATGNALRTPPRPTPLLLGLFSVFRANAPQLYVNLNREQCMTMDVPLADAFNTLQVYLGSLYVNDFNRFGRTWQVVVQADAPFRNQVDDVKRLKVRNQDGTMVPIGALADVREINGPFILTRYNMYPAAAINGNAGPGVSSRQAIDLMQGLADAQLPSSMSYEWTEMAYLQLQAGNTAMWIFALAVVMVFLVLAAQYESWSLPMAVILVVPMCLLSAIVGVMVGRSDVNIFTQIGFVVLVGLASKNAILIVEFARRQREAGVPRREAAMEACQLRLRPIIMTSLAFILGVVPLLIAQGAGAEMRRTLGLAVFSGMLGVTLFGIFLTPVFFNVIDWLGTTRGFDSRPMRWVRFITLQVFALGFIVSLLRLLTTAGRRRFTKNGSGDNSDTSK